MAGIWLLPTRGRIANLRRFLNAAREMGTTTGGWILLDDDDYAENKSGYDAAAMLAPVGWTVRIIKNKDRCYGGALRAAWDDIKDFDWAGLVSDDLVPCSGNWDTSLVSAVVGWNMVSSNDGWQATTGNINQDRLHGAIVWSGPLMRAIGYMFPPGLKHIFHDNVMETLGRATGCWQVRIDIMCKHLHEALDGVRGPTMDPNSDLWKHDEAWFNNWMETEKDSCVKRVQDLMANYGVKTISHDFRGIKLLIATPCIDGKYESSFMAGLFQTMKMLDQSGCACQFAEEKYTADIALARSKIMGAFMRGDYTHLLMIDADMGWKPDAVIRLFHAHKDFVAIAGPKKRYPLQFAANYTDAKGNPVMLTFDRDSGTMEVGEIGSAFCLVARGLAERMAAAYPELAFIGVTGEQEYAFYNPMVVNGRFYSEDFAFCKRWREIGGRVHFVPDVPLMHTGSHTFAGSFAESAAQNAAQNAQLQQQAAE